MATETGVWDLQQVRDKQLQSEWTYNAPGGDTGALWTWGSSQYGQLGHNSRTQRSSPMQVGTDSTWNTFTNGGDSDICLGMKGDGTLWSWGKNNDGGLGLNEQGPSSLKSSPTQIPGTWTSHSSRGNYHKFAIKSGKLYSWGANTEGELGLNDIVRRSSPTQIGTGTDWASVDGIDNTGGAAIKTNGTLWVWGRNNRGQLGLNYVVGEPGGVSSPAQVGTDTTWSKVQGSYLMGMGLKTDGSLWSWGSNLRGQLGQNSPNPAPYLGGFSSPVQIPGTWSDFNAGGIGLGLKPDGTIWAWGNNQNGPLGQNENGNRISSPTQIGTDTTWSKIVGATYGLKTDGTFWAWGFNTTGKQGLNDQAARSSPTQVGTDTDWLRIAEGGGNHMGAIREA